MAKYRLLNRIKAVEDNSGTPNLKTVNGQSLLGTGNVTISGEGARALLSQYDDLSDAITQIGSTVAVLEIDADVTITSAITVPETLQLNFSGNDTTGDYTMDFTVSAGNQRGKGTCQGLTAAAAVSNVIVTAAGVASTTAIPIGAPTASLDDLVAVKVTYAITASADATFRFRFGNAAAAAGRTSRTWKGSVFRYKRLD